MLKSPRQAGLLKNLLRCVSMFAALALLSVGTTLAQPPSIEHVPYQTATRPAPQEQGRWPNFGAILDARQPRQHQAVARIIVPEGPATAYGTGTLVDVRDGFGLVVTNWHVVRDATGVVEVVFPNGFRSQARALKVDQDWDLAALVIWEPSIEPVKLATRAPRPGDLLTIHGYGQGDYRVASGRCTQYYAPRVDFPQEMVELDVEARQGDSGGPIFNQHGELAGVLFGAGQGTTVGSFGGRVESFLATLAPGIGRSQNEALVSMPSQPPVGNLVGKGLGTTNNNNNCPPSDPYDEWASGRQATLPNRNQHNAFASGFDTAVASTNWPTTEERDPAAASPWQEASSPTLTTQPAETTSYPINKSNLLDRAKSILAIVGLLAVCVQIVRIVT